MRAQTVFATLLALLAGNSFAQEPQPLYWLTVELEDLRGLPPQGENPSIYHGFGGYTKLYALHNGDAVVFREGEPFLHPPTGPGFAWHRGLVNGLLSADPDARIDGMILGGPNVLESGNQVWGGSIPLADPSKHRFLSYFVPLCPSDDAFFANESLIEIFDAEGNFTGPLVIDIYGSDVMDAGQRENNEVNLRCLDDNAVAASFAGVPTNEPVTRHLGFNGSYGNPSATPVRILGASGNYLDENNRPRFYSYQPEFNDFSQPDFPIARLRIASGPHGGFNGTFYDPTRSGEGVTIEVHGKWESRQVTLAWYTYLPDGSGDQVYLYGVGPVTGNGGNAEDIVLYRTQGGVFASPENPTLVNSERWGTATVRFGSCVQVELIDIRPDDQSWVVPDIISLQRAAPLPTGFERYCGGFVRGIAPFM